MRVMFLLLASLTMKLLPFLIPVAIVWAWTFVRRRRLA